MKQQTHVWLDIALAAPLMTRTSLEGIEDPQWDRQQRVYKAIPAEITPDDWHSLDSYGEAIGAWAMTANWLEDWMPQELIEALRALAPDAVGVSDDFHTLVVKQYLTSTVARLDAVFRPGRGIYFTTNSSAPLHGLTTAPWIEFDRNPYPIQLCAQCGAPFTGQRKSAQFCSGACRQAAHMARKDPTQEQIDEAKQQDRKLDEARKKITRMLRKGKKT